jgi:hypothetical protein
MGMAPESEQIWEGSLANLHCEALVGRQQYPFHGILIWPLPFLPPVWPAAVGTVLTSSVVVEKVRKWILPFSDFFRKMNATGNVAALP